MFKLTVDLRAKDVSKLIYLYRRRLVTGICSYDDRRAKMLIAVAEGFGM